MPPDVEMQVDSVGFERGADHVEGSELRVMDMRWIA